MTALLAPALAPLALARDRQALLQRGLLARARSSAQAHRRFVTVRHEDGRWQALAPGVALCPLSATGGLRVDRLRLAPGAPLGWLHDAQAIEILVLDGALVVDSADGAAGAPVQLLPQRQWVLAHGAPWRLRAGPAGASLYLRSRIADLAQLPAAEAQWWAAAQRIPAQQAAAARAWAPYQAGVDAAVLQAHGDVASMLVRMAPGASVPDHGHSLDEDCFMMEGHMFLGDILLRGGDYQRAPVGCQHVRIASDTGGLFYFHGAVPAAGAAP